MNNQLLLPLKKWRLKIISPEFLRLLPEQVRNLQQQASIATTGVIVTRSIAHLSTLILLISLHFVLYKAFFLWSGNLVRSIILWQRVLLPWVGRTLEITASNQAIYYLFLHGHSWQIWLLSIREYTSLAGK